MSERVRLPERRPNVSRQVDWIDPASGSEIALHVCVGLDLDGRPMEVFASCVRKPHSTLSSLLSESCVLLSRDLQHGRPVEELATAFTRAERDAPATPLGVVIGVLAEVAAEFQGEAA